MNDDLKTRQAASAATTKKMMELLLGFTPAEQLKLADAKFIAESAGRIAFDEFSPKTGP